MTALPALPEGFTRSYSQIRENGKVAIQKWWLTASCRDAFARVEAEKRARLAAMRAVARKGEGRSGVSGEVECQGSRRPIKTRSRAIYGAARGILVDDHEHTKDDKRG